jgi:hypothetical protein
VSQIIQPQLTRRLLAAMAAGAGIGQDLLRGSGKNEGDGK